MLKFKTTSVTPPGGWRYMQQETGVELRHLTWSGFLSMIVSHRKSNGIAYSLNWIDELTNEMCLSGRYDCYDDRDGIMPPLKTAGRILWGELHEYAARWNGGEAEALAWLARWEARIPRYECDCANKWLALRAEFPADLSSGGAFYRWTVDMHNRVNVSLGKPAFQPH